MRRCPGSPSGTGCGAAEGQSDDPPSWVSFEPHEDQVLHVLAHRPVRERFEKQNAMGWSFLPRQAGRCGAEPMLPREARMQPNAPHYGADLANPRR